METFNKPPVAILPCPKQVSLMFQGQRLSIQIPNDHPFAFIFMEIFVDQTYQVDFLQSPKCIVDVGAYAGLVALYYHCLYPMALIHSF